MTCPPGAVLWTEVGDKKILTRCSTTPGISPSDPIAELQLLFRRLEPLSKAPRLAIMCPKADTIHLGYQVSSAVAGWQRISVAGRELRCEPNYFLLKNGSSSVGLFELHPPFRTATVFDALLLQDPTVEEAALKDSEETYLLVH
ncbi:hypothetical protein NDU88_007613 [Pleurodeles waltl]|uniref:Uncharacterized protein n=1 Tax=Pleurodeles waltl TaxID=8319 RepID=A0AAV7U3L4_PLEWA|nr:hypothetical protein NDU88_007613 [Pleurodeles waltl]